MPFVTTEARSKATLRVLQRGARGGDWGELRKTMEKVLGDRNWRLQGENRKYGSHRRKQSTDHCPLQRDGSLSKAGCSPGLTHTLPIPTHTPPHRPALVLGMTILTQEVQPEP